MKKGTSLKNMFQTWTGIHCYISCVDTLYLIVPVYIYIKKEHMVLHIEGFIPGHMRFFRAFGQDALCWRTLLEDSMAGS